MVKSELFIAYKSKNRPFLIPLRRYGEQWTFLKIDPDSGINLGYHCNPPPPLNLAEFGVPATHQHQYIND